MRWRIHGEHHNIQEKGRFEVFEDYRIRVGEVAADTETPDLRQTRLEVTQQGRGEAATVTQVPPEGNPPEEPPASDELLGAEWYAGIDTEGERLLLATWKTIDAAEAWSEAAPSGHRNRVVRIVRNYGMYECDEAPQYYPPVERQTADT